MSIKAKIEAIIYAAEDPVTLDQIATALKDAGLSRKLMKPVAAVSAKKEPADVGEAATWSAPAPEAESDEPHRDPKAAKAEMKARIRELIDEMIAEAASEDHGMEVRHVAGGYRMATKPEHHDVVKSFAKSLKLPIRLSLQALETLAVIAYKQPVTGPEISEIRGVDSSGVLSTLIDRKLITTAGRKEVVGRPILYKTTKDFLMRFGLNDVSELPSMEEFEKMTQGPDQEEMFNAAPVADATGFSDSTHTEPAGEDTVDEVAENHSQDQ